MNLIKFNKDLHLDQGNHQHTLGDDRIESIPAEDLGILLDEKLASSCVFVLRGKIWKQG